MKRFAYLDIEATHSHWIDAEIIEIAFIIKNDEGKELDYFHSLIQPQGELTPEITELTGINQTMLNQAPELHEVAHLIAEKLFGCTIVAHKAEFDFGLLNKEMSRLELPLKNKVICTLALTQRLIPELRSYSLKSLCKMLQIEFKNNHRAMDDVIALFELHNYLRLINGELNHQQTFLPEHEKLIKKTPKRPGVICFKGHKKQEIFKTENVHLKLKELLSICPQNKERLQNEIKVVLSASLIRAGLIQSTLEKPYYPFCIYQVKTKAGLLILKMGKTIPHKRALYYCKTKKQAQDIMKKLVKSNTHFAYQDSKDDFSEITRKNIELKRQIKKLVSLDKNYLVRSLEKWDGKYQYTVIRKNNTFARFESDKLISHSNHLHNSRLKFKKMGPREYMALNHSPKWIKNQRHKTDFLIELKEHSCTDKFPPS